MPTKKTKPTKYRAGEAHRILVPVPASDYKRITAIAAERGRPWTPTTVALDALTEGLACLETPAGFAPVGDS